MGEYHQVLSTPAACLDHKSSAKPARAQREQRREQAAIYTKQAMKSNKCFQGPSSK